MGEPAPPGGSSGIGDHGSACCRIARTWLRRIDDGFHRGRGRAAPPAWIADRWRRGACPRTLHWCEVAEADELDDRLRAALARALWSARCDGLLAVRILAGHAPGAPGWQRVAPPVRDAIARRSGERIEIWDPAIAAWLSPPGPDDPAPSVRVAAADAGSLRWGAHTLASGG